MDVAFTVFWCANDTDPGLAPLNKGAADGTTIVDTAAQLLMAVPTIGGSWGRGCGAG